jgi:polyhydroxybutyrate depolymerase
VRRAAPLVALLTLVAACGGGPGPTRDEPARAQDAGPCAQRGADVRVGSAILHIPRGRGGGPFPLVVALHGAGGNGTQAAFLGFSALGDEEGFASLYPTARRRGFWSLDATFRPDDLPVFRDLLARVLREPCLDDARVFVTGVSNGGGFAARVGCTLRVRGIAPVAGGYRAVRRCRSGRPVGVLEIHGSADAVVPYEGRGPTREGSVPRYLRDWARRNRCTSGPVSSRLRRLVLRQRWRGCRAPVEHLRLDRTGHGWPGLFVARPGDPTGVEATREIWRFFSRL